MSEWLQNLYIGGYIYGNCKQLQGVIKMNKERKIIIDFSDMENLYAKIETKEKNVEKIKDILNNYRENNNYYNIDDFIEILVENKIEFEKIPTYCDVDIYF